MGKAVSLFYKYRILKKTDEAIWKNIVAFFA
jgi:hypothetical protein